MKKSFLLIILLSGAFIFSAFTLNPANKTFNKYTYFSNILSGTDDLSNIKAKSFGAQDDGFKRSFSISRDYIYFGKSKANFNGDFVIMLDGELRLGGGHYHLSDESMYVKGAGEIGIKNGKIHYIDNHSGHYRPNRTELAGVANVLANNNLVSEDFEPFVRQ